MKTQDMSSSDTIWTNNVDLLTDENALPVIGSCQVSSILSNLDSNFKLDSVSGNPALTGLEGTELNLLHGQVGTNGYVASKAVDAKVADKVKSGGASENVSIESMKYFLCQLCPFFCTRNTKITEHLDNAHKNKSVRKLPSLKCPACANVFFHKMSLRSHLIHDHGIGNSDLGQIIQAVVYLANKEKAKENKSRNKAMCGIVSKLNKIKAELHSSKSNTSEESEPKSEVSKLGGHAGLPKVEISQNNINTMMAQNPVSKLINSKKMHRCIISACKVQMHSMDNLNYHLSCHKENGFVCLICNESFGFWKPLSSHLWRLHQINMELYSCDRCDYKSVSLAKLNNIHKLIHGDVKAFVCDVCKKAFKNSKQLGNHKITHKSDNERLRFVCPVCVKNFSDRRQLKIHMDVVHDKIRPFLCSYCGYKGSSRSSLKMHIRQHTGEKPFACGLCSYTTSDHNSLRRHKLRHTGQKPYKCIYCPYACIQSSTYKVHLKTKHPGQEKDLMFTCAECQFRSVNKEMYTSHMVTVHHQKPH